MSAARRTSQSIETCMNDERTELAGKVALITGSSRGIGRGIALELASAGCDVMLTGRDAKALESVAAEVRALGRKAAVHAADLTAGAEPARLIGALTREFGRLDILVNNAGGARRGDFFTQPEADWRDGFELKFFAHVRLCRLAWPLLKAAQGSVVFIEGIGARAPVADYMIGACVIGAGLAFMKALADLGKHDGVQVNAVNPGSVTTDRFRHRLDIIMKKTGLDEAAAIERHRRELDITRFGTPEDIAALVRFIVSPRGRLLHGASHRHGRRPERAAAHVELRLARRRSSDEPDHASRARHVPVLIVGGGPVGLALAAELGWRGIACELVEQGDGVIATPKMNEVNVRTMEFCRRWGIAEAVRNCPFPDDHSLDVVFVTSLGGHELARMRRPTRAQQKAGSQSPERLQICSQLWFDPILRAFAQSQPAVTLRYRTRLEAFEQTRRRRDGRAARSRNRQARNRRAPNISSAATAPTARSAMTLGIALARAGHSRPPGAPVLSRARSVGAAAAASRACSFSPSTATGCGPTFASSIRRTDYGG